MEHRVSVDYAPAEGGWIATGGDQIAFGRTLEKARENIAVALGKARRTHPGSVVIDDVIAMSPATRKRVTEARDARSAALEAEARSRRATLVAVRNLQEAGMSLRDIAYVLGISHSRVHQIVQKET